MAIENRNLEPGTNLVAHYKKEVYRALVVAGEEGRVLYQFSPYDGREFKSPSALGTAITGKACNGWTFWSGVPDEAQTVETSEAFPEGFAGTDTPADAASEAEEPAEEDFEPESTYVAADAEFTGSTDRPRFHKVPNQKGVDPGQVRLHCYTCRSLHRPRRPKSGHLPHGPRTRITVIPLDTLRQAPLPGNLPLFDYHRHYHPDYHFHYHPLPFITILRKREMGISQGLC
jgi:hypothetical protein